MNAKIKLLVNSILISCLFLLILLFNACDSSQQNKQSNENIPISNYEKDLIFKVYQFLLFGKTISEEAITRSTANETRLLAEKIFSDNLDKQKTLTQWAEKNGLNLVPELSADQLIAWKQLIKEKGRNFDRAYIILLSTEHDKANVILKSLSLVKDSLQSSIGLHLLNQSNDHIAYAEKTKLLIDKFTTRDTTIIKPAVSKKQ